MRLAYGAALSLLALGSMTTAAMAEIRCRAAPTRVCDGCTGTVHWTVTQASPGGRHNYCSLSWSTLGGSTHFALLEPPRLGKAGFKDYWVSYTGEKLGHDRMVVKMSWVSSTNRPMSGTVTYEINVVESQ